MLLTTGILVNGNSISPKILKIKGCDMNAPRIIIKKTVNRRPVPGKYTDPKNGSMIDLTKVSDEVRMK